MLSRLWWRCWTDVVYGKLSVGNLVVSDVPRRAAATTITSLGKTPQLPKQALTDPHFLLITSTPQTPGYTTTDDFGKDGDDTPHSTIPSYRQPSVIQANASFPADGSTPTAVDLVFLDFIAPNVVSALNGVGAKYSASDVAYYLPRQFTTNSYLPAYAKLKWQKGMPSCPVGGGF